MELLDTKANPLKIYRQAKKILKGTSRAKNPDWYRRAHEVQLQWHIWVGSQKVVSGIYNQAAQKWFTGPDLPRVSFSLDEAGNPDGLDDNSRNTLHEILRQLLGTKEFGFKPKSIGIIFHLADGLRVRDLAPDFAADDDFESLNELLTTAPEIGLGDDSLRSEEGKWRLLPLLGIQEGEKRSIAVQVSSQYEFIIDELRGYGELRNIPIVVEVASAALECMAAIPKLYPEGGAFENMLSLLQFDSFTLLCATGKRGELIMLRPLIHRSGSTLSPAETSDYITNTAALLNIKAPKILLVSTTGILEDELNDLLAIYKEANPEAACTCINACTSPLVEHVPDNRFELGYRVSDLAAPSEDAAPLHHLGEKWAIQDFYGISMDEVMRMPTRGDLRLLKFASLAQKIAVVTLFGFAGWTGMDFFTKMRSEAWKLAPTAATEMSARLVGLQKERREWEHWEGLLAKRSEGWLAMETILSLFPDNGGVILSTAGYRTEVSGTDTDKKMVGLSRVWQVSGYANPEVATQLPTLGSRSRVAALLNEIAEENKAPYLNVDPDTRDIDVSLQQRQGTMPPTAQFPAKVARHFRTAFELNITQNTTPQDELALSTQPLSSSPE